MITGRINQITIVTKDQINGQPHPICACALPISPLQATPRARRKSVFTIGTQLRVPWSALITERQPPLTPRIAAIRQDSRTWLQFANSSPFSQQSKTKLQQYESNIIAFHSKSSVRACLAMFADYVASSPQGSSSPVLLHTGSNPPRAKAIHNS